MLGEMESLELCLKQQAPNSVIAMFPKLFSVVQVRLCGMKLSGDGNFLQTYSFCENLYPDARSEFVTLQNPAENDMHCARNFGEIP